MKLSFSHTFFLFIASLLASCASGPVQEPAEAESDTEMNFQTCDKEVTYGGRSICLPILENYKEAYADQVVASRFKPLNPGNLIFALYLPEAVLDSFLLDTTLVFDDYFKVYAFRKKWEYFANDAAVSEAQAAWIEELSRAPRVPGENPLPNLPRDGVLIIDQYRPDNYCATSVHLARVKVGGEDRVAILTMNTLAVRTKLLFFSYYMFWEGPESVARAKKRNDAFAEALLEANY